MDYTQDFLRRAVSIELTFRRLGLKSPYEDVEYKPDLADAHYILLLTPHTVIERFAACFLLFGFNAFDVYDFCREYDANHPSNSSIPLKMCFNVEGAPYAVEEAINRACSLELCSDYITTVRWNPSDIQKNGYTMCTDYNAFAHDFCLNCNRKEEYCFESFYRRYNALYIPSIEKEYDVRLVAPRVFMRIYFKLENEGVQTRMDKYDFAFVTTLMNYQEMFMSNCAARFLQCDFAPYLDKYGKPWAKFSSPAMYDANNDTYRKELLGNPDIKNYNKTFEEMIYYKRWQIAAAKQTLIPF